MALSDSRAKALSTAATVAAVLALLAGVEAASRLGFFSPYAPVLERWAERAPRPYTMFGDCMTPPPAGPKPAGEFRVVMLGGSTVALGEPPIPDLLEKALHRRGLSRVRVYNCGTASQNSGQQLARLLFDVVDAAPDLVVAYDGGNDATDPFLYDPRPGYPMNFIAYEKNPLFIRKASHYPLLALVLFSSQALRDLMPLYFSERLLQLGRQRRLAGYGNPQWRSLIARVYVEHHRKAEVIARAFGAGYIVFFQPVLFYKEPIAPIERYDYPPAFKEHTLAVRAEMRREFAAIPKGAAPRIIDMSDEFHGVAEKVYLDYIHTVQPAKEAVAESIAARLVEAPELARARR